MLGAGKIFLSIKLMEIGGMMKRGNKKSQELGDALENVVRLYTNDEVKFDGFIQDFESEYQRASNRYNKEYYQGVGGVPGSSQLKALTPEDMKDLLGKDVRKMIDGLDPEGFYNFQAFVYFVTDAANGKIPLASPEDAPSFPFMLNYLRVICWYTLFSVYYDDCLENLKKMVKKHKLIDPSLN